MCGFLVKKKYCRCVWNLFILEGIIFFRIKINLKVFMLSLLCSLYYFNFIRVWIKFVEEERWNFYGMVFINLM